eukprot:1008097-Rhodomonas_salina.2
MSGLWGRRAAALTDPSDAAVRRLSGTTTPTPTPAPSSPIQPPDTADACSGRRSSVLSEGGGPGSVRATLPARTTFLSLSGSRSAAASAASASAERRMAGCASRKSEMILRSEWLGNSWSLPPPRSAPDRGERGACL